MNEIPMLSIYTIFNNPLDYPNKVVVRQFKIKAGKIGVTDNIVLCDSVEEARNKIPKNLSVLMRSPNDHTSVVESWI